MSQIGRLFDRIAPDPRELWERGGASIETVEREPGHSSDVPYFYSSRIDTIEPVGDGIDICRGETVIGSRLHYQAEMTTGIRREVTVYLPPIEKRLQASVTIHMDTPWFTGTEGHNDKIAEGFMHHTDQPVVLIGPELMPSHKDPLYVLTHLAAVATESSKVSLALAAQDSVQIGAEMATEHYLPRQFVQVGESRGAMIAPAKYPHTAEHGITNVYYDITDPCVAENILLDGRNILRVPLFPVRELANIMPVALDLAKRRSLHRELGTVPKTTQYLAAAALGTGPAIFSGESGLFPAFLPSASPVHLVNFQKNPLSHHDLWREKYGHTQFAGVNLRAAHLGLAYSSVQRHVIERIKRFIYELQLHSGQTSLVDLSKVHLFDDQSMLGPHEHMPDINE